MSVVKELKRLFVDTTRTTLGNCCPYHCRPVCTKRNDNVTDLTVFVRDLIVVFNVSVCQMDSNTLNRDWHRGRQSRSEILCNNEDIKGKEIKEGKTNYREAVLISKLNLIMSRT